MYSHPHPYGPQPFVPPDFPDFVHGSPYPIYHPAPPQLPPFLPHNHPGPPYPSASYYPRPLQQYANAEFPPLNQFPPIQPEPRSIYETEKEYSSQRKSPTPVKATHEFDKDIDEFWRGRIAPLPEFTSRPGLLGVKDSKAIKITKPVRRRRQRLKLLPPHSFMAPADDSGDDDHNQDSFKENANNAVKSPPVSQLDKYADIFVPQYLKDIQKNPHTLLPIPPISIFPSVSYLQTYLPSSFIKETRKSSFPLLAAPPSNANVAAAPLTAGTYCSHWSHILRWELDNIATEKEQITLWKIPVKVAMWDNAHFALFVPGIRENYPRLDIGDLLHMREVIERNKTGSGKAFEGRIAALRKREGILHFYSPTLKEYIENSISHNELGPRGLSLGVEIPILFNVSFIANAGPAYLMGNAVTSMADMLRRPVSLNPARQWLFPEPEDFLWRRLVTDEHFIEESNWVDKGLNEEQRQAASFVAVYRSSVPHLISGPPGTGKTRTVVEAVLQILRLQPEACILLCAPSNPATDTLVQRLRTSLLPKQMLRLNDPHRTFAEIPNTIMPYCHVEDNKFALPPWKTLMDYRVVACACQDANILVKAQCTNQALVMLEEYISNSIHPRQGKQQFPPHWTHLLIDEAAQGSEPELLIPISVVVTNLTDEACEFPSIPQLVLCGDVNQLGPIVTSDDARKAELDVSLLERLFDRPLYADYKQTVSPYHDVRTNSLALKTEPYTNLVKNYRSHPVILMPPSAMFYGDSLVPCATNGKIFWTGLPNPRLPLKFIGNNTAEESVNERATWYNNGEIGQVLGVIKSLMSEAHRCIPPLLPEQIGVMAPWREQVWKIRERLRNEGLSAVDVGSVEDYQGRESRVIIISCVRSNPRFLQEDHKKGLGLVLERKRMNVAITRAKELLVVIGDGSLLQKDPYWKGFLQFAARNELYVGPHIDLENDGNYISRLESALNDSRDQDEQDFEVQGLLVAGGIAREVLRE